MLPNLDNEIGSGAYGTIYGTSDDKVVFKKFKSCDEGLPIDFLRELCSIKKLSQSSKCVNIIDISTDPENLGYSMPKFNQDLTMFRRKSQRKNHPNHSAKSILYQLLEGLFAASEASISHRDIKPANILMSDTDIVICDWGISRFMGGNDPGVFTNSVQTLWWRSPELLLGTQKYGSAIEIWSAGVIMCELLIKKPFLTGNTDIDQLFKIFKVFGTPSKESWPDIEDYAHFKTTFPKWKKQNLRSVLRKPTKKYTSKKPHKKLRYSRRTKFRKLRKRWKSFRKSRKKEVQRRIQQRPLRIPAECIDLLEKMLAMNPKDRIDVVGALNHQYFDDIRQDTFTASTPLGKMRKLNPTLEESPINYFCEQDDINNSMRIILFDWLIEVTFRFRSHTSTLFLAFSYIDRYLDKKIVKRTHLQLVGITCFLIASKIDELHPCHIGDCVYICDRAYPVDQLENMEIDIVTTLSYDLYIPTEYTYMSILSKRLPTPLPFDFNKALYYLYISIYNDDFMSIPKENIAKSSILLAQWVKEDSDESILPMLPDLVSKIKEYDENGKGKILEKFRTILRKKFSDKKIPSL